MHAVTHRVHTDWNVCVYSGFGDNSCRCDHPEAINPLCNPECPNKRKLSNDLLVAIQIYKSQPSWFSKLVDEFKGILSESEISHCLDTLFDWGIIYGEYGETTPGRAGRLLKLTEDGVYIISEL